MNSTSPACSTIPARPQKTIFVVDDNDMVRRTITQILESDGNEVFSSESPQRALHQITSWTKAPDLMICDICMPVISGFDLYRQIEQRFPRQPVLFITGYPDGHSAMCHDLLNEHNLLRKPFRVAELLQRVHKLIA